MRKQTKLVAVLSAAALLAIGASMTSFAAAGWAEEDGTWVYLDKYGDRVYDEWKKSGSNYFYLDENGEMATERVVDGDDNDKFYVDANGARVTNRWVSVDNEDDVEVGGNSVSTLWLYFGSNGKAYKASNGDKVVKEISTSGTKLKYIFDSDGYMLSGWQEIEIEKEKDDAPDDLYYLGTENEGWALTNWQYLEPDDNISNDEYDDSKWFYFGGGKAKRAETDKVKTDYIDGKYYTFNEDGVMESGWYDVSTPPTAASGADAYAYGAGNVGTGWVLTTPPGKDDDDEKWYYLVNLRDEDGKVARGIPFNFNGDDYAAKYIKNKTYLFEAGGAMKKGIVPLDELEANASKGSKALAAGIYYFSEADGSAEGQMVTGKVTVTKDGEDSFYYMAKDGRAYTNELRDGSIYGEEGKRWNAEDGSTYMVKHASDIKHVNYTVETVVNPTTKESEEVIKENFGDFNVVVSSSGKVKKSGSVRIDGDTYVIGSTARSIEGLGGTHDYEVVRKPSND